jgi:hypothetical protein
MTTTRRRYRDLQLLCVNDATEQPVTWLWPNRLPLGKLTILDGDPGLGKSLLTLDLCARITRGAPFPETDAMADSSSAIPPAGAVILNSEDGIEDTIKPRLRSLGADLHRVHVLKGVIGERGEELIALPSHTLAVRDAIQRVQARLVVIDPLMAFLEKGVITSNHQSVHRALAPLAALAEAHACAVLLVRHLNKTGSLRAIYRGTGSVGFTGICRAAWLLAADPQDPTRRVLASLKTNLAPPQPSLSFMITGPPTAPELRWLGASPLSANELLSDKSAKMGRPPLASERAQEQLRVFLREQPRTAQDVQEFTSQRKISRSTLTRVKGALEVRSVPALVDGYRVSYWLLPGQTVAGAIDDPPPPGDSSLEDEIVQDAAYNSQHFLEELARHGPEAIKNRRG